MANDDSARFQKKFGQLFRLNIRKSWPHNKIVVAVFYCLCDYTPAANILYLNA
jgi:hypothetical protein